MTIQFPFSVSVIVADNN